ncbi:ACT domain-containing protein [Microvirga puerhi]|uniref:ACT domain-containing protein n=1 Tax=Microvirga puerhi TaxID=2876078 RepID=A0ABS7VJR3_9HYPH|nr:ACT domain-containing protein [Microvirga puerhi]MBZ6075459.1 ACT domain-containing protein [Microvirga puerhi]
MPNLTLSLLEDDYAVCRLPPGAVAKVDTSPAFALVVRAPEETTVVCRPHDAPEGAEIDPGWRCLRIEQTFDFSVPGILASVLSPLAAAGIGIFATSTFSTDYVLVKANNLAPAIAALAKAGHHVIGQSKARLEPRDG